MPVGRVPYLFTNSCVYDIQYDMCLWLFIVYLYICVIDRSKDVRATFRATCPHCRMKLKTSLAEAHLESVFRSVFLVWKQISNGKSSGLMGLIFGYKISIAKMKIGDIEQISVF